jgi:hypothetical protein
MRNACDLQSVRSIVGAVALAAVSAASAAAEMSLPDAVIDAVSRSDFTGSFRLRPETVDADTTAVDDASALTLRSRLGVETAPLSGFTVLLEFEDIRVVAGQDDYAPERAGFATIVDPEQTEVNRAYLRYRGISRLDLGLGRQRIVLDNQRFVGNVGWRQDEQTFDAFTAAYTGIPDWTLYYGYVQQVNGIADVVPNMNFDIESSDHLVNAAWTGSTLGKATAYYYALENDEPQAALLNQPPYVGELNPALRYRNNDTTGLRFDGGYALATTRPIRLLYTVEVAWQSLEAPSGIEFENEYSLVDVGASLTTGMGPVSVRVAQEVLGSDTAEGAQQGFQTPYATKHVFNGWVDMFLNTPASGIEDRFVTLAADVTAYALKLAATFHEYAEDAGPAGGGSARDYGAEWNVQATRQFGAHYTVGAKYGSYDADDEMLTLIGTTANVDTEKFWLWLEVTF